jgi:maltose alpha-D-glucosyltransferase / alpha-amylase
MINDLWYKNAVIYCLSVATYMDANGDGTGDVQGLTRRLDYLQGMGVTAMWLMPFQPSPFKDDGYDVADYYGVDSRCGTLGDFVEFARGCRQRGMRLLIDLVVNHTSNEHPWFREARRDARSKYRDWYVWSKNKPKNAASGIVFPAYRSPRGVVQQVCQSFRPYAGAGGIFAPLPRGMFITLLVLATAPPECA